VVELFAGFAPAGRGKADTIGPDVHRAVQHRRPPRATGVVGQLLVDHADDHRLPDVVVGLVRQTQVAKDLVSQLIHPHSGRVRLRAGLETGYRAQVHELMARRVGDCEVEENARHSANRRTGNLWEVGDLGEGDLLEVATRLTEHRVVDRVLGLEVAVERRRPHAHPLGKVAQGELDEAFLLRELPRRVKDLRTSRLTAFGYSIALRNNYHN
jgi:hypothetical protein